MLLENKVTVTQGLVVGAIGAAIVSALFLLLDVATGRPFFTPAALGSALFLGVTDPSAVRISPVVIAGYTLLHLGVFCAVGVLFAFVARGVSRSPRLWLMALMTFILLDSLFIGTMVPLASWVLGTMGFWEIIIGNVLAVAGMSAGIWFTTPVSRRHVPELVETAV